MKRLLCAVLALALSLAAFAGCGSGDSSSAASSSAAPVSSAAAATATPAPTAVPFDGQPLTGETDRRVPGEDFVKPARSAFLRPYADELQHGRFTRFGAIADGRRNPRRPGRIPAAPG